MGQYGTDIAFRTSRDLMRPNLSVRRQKQSRIVHRRKKHQSLITEVSKFNSFIYPVWCNSCVRGISSNETRINIKKCIGRRTWRGSGLQDGWNFQTCCEVGLPWRRQGLPFWESTQQRCLWIVNNNWLHHLVDRAHFDRAVVVRTVIVQHLIPLQFSSLKILAVQRFAQLLTHQARTSCTLLFLHGGQRDPMQTFNHGGPRTFSAQVIRPAWVLWSVALCTIFFVLLNRMEAWQFRTRNPHDLNWTDWSMLLPDASKSIPLRSFYVHTPSMQSTITLSMVQ